MSETINANHIIDELKAIRNDLDFIKGHMVDKLYRIRVGSYRVLYEVDYDGNLIGC